MAVHELATNALRYGSLSSSAGRIEMTWSVDHRELGLTLVVDWSERGGLPPKRYPRAGLGMRLITLLIERQLNGHVQQKFEPGGLHVMLHDLKQPLTVGQSVPLVITLAGGATLKVTAAVRPLSAE